MEWKNRTRCDGIAMSVYNIIACALIGVCTGIFNGLLSGAGYVEPELVDGITVVAAQSEAVKSAITFSFVGLEVITGIFLAGLLVFLNVEKDIAAKQAEIAARREK
jgi:GPH family glycoside/pentoside/hexuronide:cation symporter